MFNFVIGCIRERRALPSLPIIFNTTTQYRPTISRVVNFAKKHKQPAKRKK